MSDRKSQLEQARGFIMTECSDHFAVKHTRKLEDFEETKLEIEIESNNGKIHKSYSIRH